MGNVMNKINKLIRESTTSGNVAQGRPALVALTKAVNDLIYKDLVAVQESSQPTATIFGVRYLNNAGEMSFSSPSDFGGVRHDNAKTLSDTEKTFVKGEVFKYNKVVYEALVDIDFDTVDGAALPQKVFTSLVQSKIRIVSEGSTVSYNEYNEEIAEATLKIDRWQTEAKTRKLKTEATLELIQDLATNGFSDKVIEDLIATEISEEINKDIIKTLQTVSKRHVSSLAPHSILNMSAAAEDPAPGRTLYRMICEMASDILNDTSFKATYVLCSPKVSALLASSGWMSKRAGDTSMTVGELKNGMSVYVDITTQIDYVLVGMKHQSVPGESVNTRTIDRVGSLFYSPYVNDDTAGAFKVINSADDFQPRYMLMTRYGLSVNPYTLAENAVAGDVYKGDDWSNLAGRSLNSRFAGILF